MSNPFFISRPSGLFCRFLVPIDLRFRVGSRYIVRALKTNNSDQARLLAAILAIALSKPYLKMRNREEVAIKKPLPNTAPYQVIDLELVGVSLPLTHALHSRAIRRILQAIPEDAEPKQERVEVTGQYRPSRF